jgi:hypothetical protein
VVAKVVVPWHNENQKNDFLKEWGVRENDSRLIMQQDTSKAGCARTKNAGIAAAVASGADVVCVLDDDCYPIEPQDTNPLQTFIDAHVECLKKQEVRMVYPTMIPMPRGMPYRDRTIKMDVAASIGLWTNIPDLDAMSQLVLGDTPSEITLLRQSIYGVMFPFCGMNFAFKAKYWADCAVLIDVPRFDDIWMGWIWEKVAYDRGCCFNTAGPLVRHARQSDVWNNLEQEVKYLKVNETLWRTIYQAGRGVSAAELRKHFFETL